MKKYIVYLGIFTTFFILSYLGTRYYSSPIPKIIHYVWLGKTPLPPEVQKIIASWKHKAPDYQIMRWDETNCDIESNLYAREAYASKKYAWASDYCRFIALEKYGGLYLDTDHILYKSPTPLLKNTRFVLSYEVGHQLSGSFIAAEPHHPMIKKILAFYNNLKEFSTLPIPVHLTSLIQNEYPGILNSKNLRTFDLSIYSPNFAMFNFGGPENVAEHLYYSLSTPELKSAYYFHNSIYFLSYSGTKIIHNGQSDFWIPINEKTGYLKSRKQLAKLISKTTDELCLQETNKEPECFPIKKS